MRAGEGGHRRTDLQKARAAASSRVFLLANTRHKQCHTVIKDFFNDKIYEEGFKFRGL